MNTAIPLLVAFVGAAFGAYFAIIKTRRERLWSDRYDALRDIVLNLELIQSYFESQSLHIMGLAIVGKEEKDRLESEWPIAKHELRKNIAKLRLVFKECHIGKVLECHNSLIGSFYNLYNETAPEDHSDGCEDISKKAGEAIEEVIKVAQNHCL